MWKLLSLFVSFTLIILTSNSIYFLFKEWMAGIWNELQKTKFLCNVDIKKSAIWIIRFLVPKSELSNEKKSVIIIENSYKQITDMWKEKDVVGFTVLNDETARWMAVCNSVLRKRESAFCPGVWWRYTWRKWNADSQNLTESSKSPASIAKSNKQWVGTCLYHSGKN